MQASVEERRPEISPDNAWVENHEVVSALLTEALGKEVARFKFLMADGRAVEPLQPAIAFEIAIDNYVGTWLIDTTAELVAGSTRVTTNFNEMRELAERSDGGFKLGSFQIRDGELEMVLMNRADTEGLALKTRRFMVSRNQELIVNAPLI